MYHYNSAVSMLFRMLAKSRLHFEEKKIRSIVFGTSSSNYKTDILFLSNLDSVDAN